MSSQPADSASTAVCYIKNNGAFIARNVLQSGEKMCILGYQMTATNQALLLPLVQTIASVTGTNKDSASRKILAFDWVGARARSQAYADDGYRYRHIGITVGLHILHVQFVKYRYFLSSSVKEAPSAAPYKLTQNIVQSPRRRSQAGTASSHPQLSP